MSETAARTALRTEAKRILIGHAIDAANAGDSVREAQYLAGVQRLIAEQTVEDKILHRAEGAVFLVTYATAQRRWTVRCDGKVDYIAQVVRCPGSIAQVRVR